jgi:hypothetical protein
MARKKKRDPSQPMRVWIELEKPLDEADGHRIAEHANNMLKRLCGGEKIGYSFQWNEHRGLYDYVTGPVRYSLADWGEWFDLEYFGR